MECAFFFLFIAFAVSHPIYDKITDRGGIIQIGGDDFLSSESLELVKMPADKSEGGLPQLKRLHELMATILKGRHSGVADGGVARAPRPKRNVNRKKPEYEYYDRWRQRNEPQILIQRRVKRDANGTEVIEDLTGQERVVQNGTEYAYNYDQFYKEFIKDEEESQRVANEMQQRPEQAEAEGLFKSLNWYLDKLGIRSRRIQMVNCTEQDRASVGLRGFDCIMADYRTNRTSLGNIIGRIVHISIVWSLILCAAITVLWMWLGVGWNWCCCLCFPCCKRLDPEANMKELKAYLVNNPPGIIHENGTEIQYDPSVREVEAFELVRFKLFTFK